MGAVGQRSSGSEGAGGADTSTGGTSTHATALGTFIDTTSWSSSRAVVHACGWCPGGSRGGCLTEIVKTLKNKTGSTPIEAGQTDPVLTQPLCVCVCVCCLGSGPKKLSSRDDSRAFSRVWEGWRFAGGGEEVTIDESQCPHF